MKSGSSHIPGRKSRKTWILLGLVSIVLVSLLGVEWVRIQPVDGPAHCGHILRPSTTRFFSHGERAVHQAWATTYIAVRHPIPDSSSSIPPLIQALTYTDDTVENGVTYTYVARAADALGNESPDSPRFVITIPRKLTVPGWKHGPPNSICRLRSAVKLINSLSDQTLARSHDRRTSPQ